MFTLYISNFFKTARESDKSYIVNHVVHFHLYGWKIDGDGYLEKNLILGIMPKNTLKTGFFRFYKKISPLMCTFFGFKSCITRTFIRCVNEARAIALVQAGTQANQSASATDHAGNKFYQKSRWQKFFFLKTQKRLVLKFWGLIRKVKSWIEQNILLLLYIYKIHLIYCKVLKVFNFKIFSSF